MIIQENEFVELLVEAVVCAAHEVAGALGGGYLESVYERALVRELALRGHVAKPHVSSSLMYKGQAVAEYSTDLVVDGRVAVDLRCAESVGDADVEQSRRYLKTSGMPVGLVINFQYPDVQWSRVAYCR